MNCFKSELTSGTLYEYRQKIAETLIYKVDAKLHADTYTKRENYDMYAEPEFTGKYLDLCMKMYRSYKEEKALENAKKVVESILRNQREDGYLGCLPVGKETLNFGVWNQTFTVLGLLSYYKETNDERALEAASRSVSYVMDYFIEGNVDILDSLNYGTQHISILYPICKLYRITKKEIYKTYIQYIVDRIKGSDLDFFNFEDILKIRSRKGIENFVVLLGILEYADILGDEEAVTSVEKYWQQTADTQIRNTGNGTIEELWTENGNGCMLLGEDIKANETCVAVGWIELSFALFCLKKEAKYLDAVDKTLYNHILASVAEDGSDFAYYQPNYGKKIKSTEANMYKCCRYRGFTLFSYMDEMLYYEDEKCIIPMIYTSGVYHSSDVEVVTETNYPFEGKIKITVSAHKEKKIKLRVPKNCHVAGFSVNGGQKDFEIAEGYITVNLQKDMPLDIELMLEFEISTEYGEIDGREYASFTYGCLLLAAQNVSSDSVLEKEKLEPQKMIPEGDAKVAFTIDDIPYCEYASADNYSVWMPLV